MDHRRVLVVEDNTDILQFYSRLLGGYDVVAVPDGNAACESLSHDPYDLIILDMHLSAKSQDAQQQKARSGLDVLTYARCQPAHANTPVFAISADDTLKSKARELGATQWMTKPIDVDKLLTCLDRSFAAKN